MVFCFIIQHLYDLIELSDSKGIKELPFPELWGISSSDFGLLSTDKLLDDIFNQYKANKEKVRQYLAGTLTITALNSAIVRDKTPFSALKFRKVYNNKPSVT